MTDTTRPELSEMDRAALVRRGIWLSYATIAYNSLEAIGSLIAGVLAGSVALVGFGVALDPVVELAAKLRCCHGITCPHLQPHGPL